MSGGGNEPPVFVWRGKALNTVGDLMDAITAIETEGEAREFMEQYRSVNPHADANVGYLSGYLGPERMREVMELFDVSHPVFGRPS